MTGPGGTGDGTGGPLPEFRWTGESELHRGWAISLRRARFVDPDGVPFERDVVRHPGAVAVVPVTASGSFLLVHQYRPAVDRWLLEIPAGTRDVADEPVEVTAARELAEEVGCAADQLTPLGTCLNTPGFCDERTVLYAAEGLREVGNDRQGVEERFLSVVEVPQDRFAQMVDDGDIEDAITILAVLRFLGRTGTER